MKRTFPYIFVRTTVGRTIARLCAERDLNQTQLAAMILVDRSHLNRLINGKQNFTLNMLVKIANGLDVPLSTLFAGLEEMPPLKLAFLDDQAREERFRRARVASGPKQRRGF